MKTFNKLYYILTFTWGIIPNIIGTLIALYFIPIFNSNVEVRYGRWVLVGGTGWGGLSMGNFVFMSYDAAASTSTLAHEIGHSIQNSIWGPLFLPVIGIPSAIRYWYRKTPLYKKKTDYDAIWFEGQATAWGSKYIEAYEKRGVL